MSTALVAITLTITPTMVKCEKDRIMITTNREKTVVICDTDIHSGDRRLQLNYNMNYNPIKYDLNFFLIKYLVRYMTLSGITANNMNE
jgi:hypothetical protein